MCLRFSFAILIFLLYTHFIICTPYSQKPPPVPRSLLLSALDIQKIVDDGYADVLSNVHRFFDTELMDLDIPYSEIGSSAGLRRVFDSLISSNDISISTKMLIRILKRYLGSRSGCVVMFPYDSNEFRSPEMSRALQRTVSYLNNNSNNAFCQQDNPLFPFSVLLTSKNVSSTIKQDVETIMPHLNSSLRVLNGNTDLKVSLRIQKGYKNCNDTESVNLRRGKIQDKEDSSAETDEKNVNSSVWIFDAVTSSQNLLHEILTRELTDLQKHFSSVLATAEKYNGTRKMKQLFNTLLTSTRISHKDLIKQANDVIATTRGHLIENLKTLCKLKTRNSSLKTKDVTNMILKKMQERIEISNETKREVEKIVANQCRPRTKAQSAASLERVSTTVPRTRALPTSADQGTTKAQQKLTSNSSLEENYSTSLKQMNNKSQLIFIVLPPSSSESESLKRGAHAVLRQYEWNETGPYKPKSNTIEKEILGDVPVEIRKLPVEIRKLPVEIRKLPIEIRKLPVDLDELTKAGYVQSLVRLYEYFKCRSFDKVMSLQDNYDDKARLMKNMIDLILRKEFISAAVKDDARIVAPFVVAATGLENRILTTSAPQNLNVYKLVSEWPINLSKLTSDGYEQNLYRIAEHLHSNYQDLIISSQKNARDRYDMFLQIIENMRKSKSINDELKHDVDIIEQYMPSHK